jgi:iron complex outermembrane receptor protein
VHACLNRVPQGCGRPDPAGKQTDDGPPVQVGAKRTDGGRADDATGAPPRLDRVIVTGRLRDELLQDTPASISVVSGEELASRHADDLSALQAAVPNVSIHAARPFNNTITATIRGVGQSETVWGVETGVGVYLDDVYIARPQSALLDILDVERIEVLRGPQGTLYGRNTLGGAIRYLTRVPEASFGGQVSATLGDYGRRDAKAILNLPLGSQWRTRVAIGKFTRDGYGTNLVTGADVGARDAAVARIAADWSASDAFDVRLAWDAYRDRSGPRASHREVVNPQDPAQTPVDPGRYDTRSGLPDLDRADVHGASVTLDWHASDWWRLKSISAMRHEENSANVDFDLLPSPISDLHRDLYEDQASQEFQWQAHGERIEGVAGVYLFDGEAAGRVRQLRPGNAMQSFGWVRTHSVAAYADATWQASARVSLEAGLRWTVERKSARVLNQGYTNLSFTTPNGRVGADFTDDTTFRSLSPRVNLSFRPTPHTLLYAQASRGYRSGGYNIRANTVALPESGKPFLDETSVALELGAKGDWHDGRVLANAALFHTDARDIQLSVQTYIDSNGDGRPDLPFGDFRNAGAGTLQGVDAELSLQARRIWRWTLYAGYLDARYDEYISLGQDIAATSHVPNAPRGTAGSSLVADLPLRERGSLEARLDGSYRSIAWPTGEPTPFLAQPGYCLWNASLRWQLPGDGWRLSLAAQNLGDKVYHSTGWETQNGGLRTLYYGAPRTIFATVDYTFR